METSLLDPRVFNPIDPGILLTMIFHEPPLKKIFSPKKTFLHHISFHRYISLAWSLLSILFSVYQQSNFEILAPSKQSSKFCKHQPVLACLACLVLYWLAFLVPYQPVSYLSSPCYGPTLNNFSCFLFTLPWKFIQFLNLINLTQLSLTLTFTQDFYIFTRITQFLLAKYTKFAKFLYDKFPFVIMSSFLRVDLRVDAIRKAHHPNRFIDHAERLASIATLTRTVANWTQHQSSEAIFRHPSVRRFM